jgi:hypothetical protein
VFAGNSDVAFADCNLQDCSPPDGHSPGAGGWPTIRYCNKDTGYGCAPYTKKTQQSMCDELGNDENMQNYVMEFGKTSLCSVDTFQGCGDKEKKFIETFKTKAQDEITKQIDRLIKMSGKSMKTELKQWLGQRLAILKQFAKSHAKEEL